MAEIRSALLVSALPFACIASILVAPSAHADSVTITSATRSVQANAEVHSTTTFGAWSDAVASGLTNASQTSNVSTSDFSIVGGLYAHWPSTNSASSGYEVHFTLNAAMHYDLSGSMSATISSFAFNGPGASALTLSGNGSTVFAYLIQPFSGGPSFYALDATGLLQPGSYTLSLQASGTGFGSSFMTSGVSDANHDVHLTLTGLCGSGSGGSCLVAHSTPFCSEADCCGLVCTIDPSCCDLAWDQLCASEAATICSSPCAADIDGSGAVDAVDLAALLGAWGSQGVADLDLDGTVSGSDIGVLFGAWGSCP